ncbi:2-dehydropantoate 2-reductase [Burkholderia ubonensis]|nr:2-dehydropantoate 2-reductase [Burkholderia ubonensis]
MARICVVGAGAPGCYVGGRLAAAGQPVTLIGRARIGDAIRNHGLTLSDRRGYRAQCAPGDVAFDTDIAAAADAQRPALARRRAVGRAGGASACRQTIACRCDAVQ